MQIKKTDWINRPESVKVRAHSLTFRSERRCAALYSLEEVGELRLVRHNKSVSFLMLHTKRDRIIFKEDHIDMKLWSSECRMSIESDNELIIKKENECVSFFSGDKCLLKISNPAFTSSASFGFLIEPSDEEILLELF